MKIAILGAGNMGGAIARAIAPAVGDQLSLTVSNPSTGKLDKLKAEIPAIDVTTDNVEAVDSANIVVLAVKPWLLPTVINEIKPQLPCEAAIVSIAGGVGLDQLEQYLECGDKTTALFHVIPNTAISVGRGMTFISSRYADDKCLEQIQSLFARMGEVAVVDEHLMDAATALSSCGIAYVFKYIQACVQAGVEMGFKPADALRYVNATVDGAVAMLRENQEMTPQQQIDCVTTPGGMTIRGINALEHAGFTSAVIGGILQPLKK